MCKIQTNRKVDSKHESVVNKFLFENYFLNCYDSATYVEDKSLQVSGVDVVVNDKMFIDIKAQSSPRYINNPTSTYILELSFLNPWGKTLKGWFLNEELKTTHNAFVWINKADVGENGYIKTDKDIHEVEIMVVDSKKLKDYILSLVDSTTLESVANELREKKIPKTFVNGLKIVCSLNIPEQPCTIVMSKEVLKKYAVSDCILTVNGGNVSLKEV